MEYSTEDISLIRMLGRGSTGTVFLGRLVGDGNRSVDGSQREVLVKIVPRRKSIIEKKISTLIDCGHKNLLCLLGYANSLGSETKPKDDVWLIYEHISRAKNLEDYCRLKLNLEWSEFQICNIFIELIDALEYLHNIGIYHMDIKPENVLIKDDIPFLIDYDLSFVPSDDEFTFRGTPLYMAPEVWASSKKYALMKRYYPEITDRTDVYSLGATFYRVLVGKPPIYLLTGEKPEDFGLKVLLADTTEIPEVESLLDLTRLMIRKNPSERPSLRDVKKKLISFLKS